MMLDWKGVLFIVGLLAAAGLAVYGGLSLFLT